VIAKWYVPEIDSPAALALRKKFKPPAVLTPLHRLELTAAWHLKVFRAEISLVLATQATDDLQADINAGVWITPSIDHGALFSLAERLCRRHSPTLGTPTLDILHVAAAVELRQRHFVTGDERQAALAGAAGLKVTTP
jgi:hypothetical protein